jgi:undecaprenyl-diphosphatase
MSRPESSQLELRHALALGVLHGPAELLPISSSGHTELVPWLLGWSYAELDGELRKAFEVALHAGTAAALLLALRAEVGEAMSGFDRRTAVLVAGSFAPAAVVGLAFERPIESHLGGPESIALGLLLGSLVMVAADARGSSDRRRTEAGAADALWLGAAQACALMPGMSRNGMTLAAARLRGFGREDANALSRHVALPIIAGATALKGTRLVKRGLPSGLRRAFAVGAGASFASTFGSTWLIRQVERDRSPLPYALYRAALATAVIRRVWNHRSR